MWVSLAPAAGQGMAQKWETGRATFYANKFNGRRTASGERLNQKALTAAHRTLPFGTRVRVVHQKTGKAIVVRITDRGPHVRGCVIDLTRAAARKLGITSSQGGHNVILQPMDKDGIAAKHKMYLPKETAPETLENKPASSLPLPAGTTYEPNGARANPKGFGLQVAAYFCQESALYEAKNLTQNGIADVFVQVACHDNGEPLYRVLVGQYPTQDRARYARTLLAAKGVAGMPAAH